MVELAKESCDQAEEAFYAAFENRNIEAMMQIWAQNHTVVCVHPQGPQLLDLESIRHSFEQIMNNSPRFSIDIDVLEEFTDGNISIRYVNEHLSTDDDETGFTILATNVYKKTENGWRMVLHHASPASVEESEDDVTEETQAKIKDEVTLH